MSVPVAILKAMRKLCNLFQEGLGLDVIVSQFFSTTLYRTHIIREQVCDCCVQRPYLLCRYKQPLKPVLRMM